MSQPSQYTFFSYADEHDIVHIAPVHDLESCFFSGEILNSNSADWEMNSQSYINESNVAAAAIMPGLKPARSVFYFLTSINSSGGPLINIWQWIS